MTTVLPPWFPQTHQEIWASWLDWRFPHYDAMERDAAEHLTGSKYSVVRVGWHGSKRRQAEWHITLFTLADETPNPAMALAATREHTPAGMLVHHVVTAAPSPDAPTPTTPRAGRLAAQIDEALRERQRLDQIAADPRTPPDELVRRHQATASHLDTVRDDAESAIAAGLNARFGFLLVPPMVIKPEALLQQLLYDAVRQLRDRLDLSPTGIPWRPTGVAVCSACGVVFRPKRVTADYCPDCRDHPPPEHVLGQRPWVPGATQTVRAPKLTGSLIRGWKTVTTGICPGCGQPFIGRKDATACKECSPRLRQRRRRRKNDGL